MPMSRLCGGTVSRLAPSRVDLPAVRSLKPAIVRSRVVLPQPLGPSSVKNSPARRRTTRRSAPAPVRHRLFVALSTVRYVIRPSPPAAGLVSLQHKAAMFSIATYGCRVARHRPMRDRVGTPVREDVMRTFERSVVGGSGVSRWQAFGGGPRAGQGRCSTRPTSHRSSNAAPDLRGRRRASRPRSSSSARATSSSARAPSPSAPKADVIWSISGSSLDRQQRPARALYAEGLRQHRPALRQGRCLDPLYGRDLRAVQ